MVVVAEAEAAEKASIDAKPGLNPALTRLEQSRATNAFIGGTAATKAP